MDTTKVKIEATPKNGVKCDELGVLTSINFAQRKAYFPMLTSASFDILNFTMVVNGERKSIEFV